MPSFSILGLGFGGQSRKTGTLTLKFIGEVDAGLEESMVKVLGQIRVEPFILSVCGVGCFPYRGQPRVVWVGFGQGHLRLFQLQLKIGITLARCEKASPAMIHQFVKKHRDFEAPPFKVNGFSLFSSRLKRQRPIYEEVQFWSFRGT